MFRLWSSSPDNATLQARAFLLRCGFYSIELDELTNAALVEFATQVSGGRDVSAEDANQSDWNAWAYSEAKIFLFNYIKSQIHTHSSDELPTDEEVNNLLGHYFKTPAKFEYEDRLQFFDADSRYVGHDGATPSRAKFIDWKPLVTPSRQRPVAPIPEPEVPSATSFRMKIFRGVALSLVVGVAIAAFLPVTGPAIVGAALAAGAWLTMGALAGVAAKAVGFAVAGVAIGLVVGGVEVTRKIVERKKAQQRAALVPEPVVQPVAPAPSPAPVSALRSSMDAEVAAFERLENGGSPAVMQAALAAPSVTQAAPVRSVTPPPSPPPSSPPRQPSPDEGLLARSMLKVVGTGAYAVGRGLQIAGQAYNALPAFRSRSQTR